MRFYRVQLDDLYLTDTGTSAGKPLKVTIDGLAEMLSNHNGTIYNALDGTPHLVKTVTSARGRILQINALFMPSNLLTMVSTKINQALANNSSITMQLTQGALGNFSFAVLPFLPDPITGGTEFSGGIAKNVTLKFVRA